MKMRQVLCLFPVLLLVVTCVQSTNMTETACKKKGKSLASLNMAKESIAKAKEFYPNCTDPRSNSSKPGCEIKEKSFGYLEVAMKLISYGLQNYPTCVGIDDENPLPKIKNKTLKYEYPMDCSQVLENGHNVSGVYPIWLMNGVLRNRVEVFCDMETAGGGWTTIQRRGKFSPQEDFFRDWATYKLGFGNLAKEFWLGNDNIFALSNQGSYSIRFDLEDMKGAKGHAAYRTFRIEGEAAKYKLHIGNFSGDVGDSMVASHDGKVFSTKDRKNDDGCGSQDCSADMKGGWWYGKAGGYCCYAANLNGLYGGKDTTAIAWISWRSYDALKSAEIKIKRL